MMSLLPCIIVVFIYLLFCYLNVAYTNMMVAAPVEGGFVAATEVLGEGAGAAVGDAPAPGAAATGPMR
jgi:hypothetical protein